MKSGLDSLSPRHLDLNTAMDPSQKTTLDQDSINAVKSERLQLGREDATQTLESDEVKLSSLNEVVHGRRQSDRIRSLPRIDFEKFTRRDLDT